MTKEELRTQALSQFDQVQEVNEWVLRGTVMGINRYDVLVYKSGQRPVTYTVYVEDDGGASEKAFVEKNVFDTPQPQPESFFNKYEAFVQSKIDDGTIVGAIVDLQADSLIESYVYFSTGNTVGRKKYLFAPNAQGEVIFKEVV